MFLLFLIVVLIFLVFLLRSPGGKTAGQSPVEVLDARYGDHLKLTIKGKEPVDISECRLSVPEQQGVVRLRPSFGKRRFYTFRSHPMNVSVQEHQVRKALSPRPVRIGDLDEDGVGERLAVCSEQNCPRRYAGTHLVLMFSGTGAPQYLPLRGENGSLRDLSRPPVRLDVHMAQADGLYWITAEGTTSSLPYTLGMGEETVSITYGPVAVPEDLDEDGQTDYCVANTRGIYWILSETGTVRQPRWQNQSRAQVVAGGEEIATMASVDRGGDGSNSTYSFRLVPDKHLQGTYWVESIIQQREGGGSIIHEGGLVRIHAEVREGLEGIRLVCPNGSATVTRDEVRGLP